MFLSGKEEKDDEECHSNYENDDYSFQPGWERIVLVSVGEVRVGCGGGSSRRRDGGIRSGH